MNKLPLPNKHTTASRAAHTVVHLRRYSIFYFAQVCAWFTVLVYYPGYMSPDSVAQLMQARFGVNSNVYPPLMDYIWHFTDKVIPGPAGMLILHNIIFWHALALIAYVTIRRPTWRFVFVALAGFWPPTYGSLGTIWKDVGMQVFLLFGLALILYAHYLRRMWPLWISFICLFVAGGYRHNAIAAAVPMIVLIVVELSRLLPHRQARLYRMLKVRGALRAFYVTVAIGSMGVLAVTLGVVFTYHVADVKLETTALVYDLVAISVRQNTNYLPPYYNPGGTITVDDMKGMYSPLHVNSLGDPSIRTFLHVANPSPKAIAIVQTLSDSQARDLERRWIAAVLDNFGSYMEHHRILAEHLLVVKPNQPWYPYVAGIDPNPFGLTFKPSRLNKEVMSIIEGSAFRSPLYSAWIYYLVVALCVAASFLFEFEYARTVQMLAVSSYLYFLSIFMFGMSGDFRYNIWMLTCAYICPVLLLMGRRKAAVEATETLVA